MIAELTKAQMSADREWNECVKLFKNTKMGAYITSLQNDKKMGACTSLSEKKNIYV